VDRNSLHLPCRPIGYVERRDPEGLTGDELRSRPACIVINPDLAEGLDGLRPGDDVLVLFWFHRSEGYALRVHPRGDPTYPMRGVFATRSPRRPNPIGATVAHILRIEGNVLEVIGLDAWDGSPVLDIKPYAPTFDRPQAEG